MNVKGFRYKLVPAKFLNVNFGFKLALTCLLLWLINSPVGGIAYAVVAGFTEEQGKELEKLLGGVAEKHKDLVKTEMETLLNSKGLMTEAAFTAKLAALEIKDKTITELTTALKEQGEEIRKLLAGGRPGTEKSIEQMIDEKAAAIKNLASDSKATFKMNFSADQVNKTLVQRAAVNNSTMAMRLQDVGQIPYLGSIMSGLFRHVPMEDSSNGTVRWIDQSLIVRGADVVGEGGTKPESQIEWTEYSASVKKIADSIPVSKEAWKDVGFIKGELQRLLEINLSLKEDAQYYSGSGAGNNIKGIKTYATEFNYAAYAATASDANIYDLLATARVDIMNSKQSKYMPATVLMNPVKILKMKLAKAADGHYILPPFISSNGTVVDGMLVVESSQVGVNEIIVGDFRYGTIYDAEGVTVEFGYVNDQFIKNTSTILAEKRTMLLVRNADLDAFRKISDVDAAVAGISA